MSCSMDYWKLLIFVPMSPFKSEKTFSTSNYIRCRLLLCNVFVKIKMVEVRASQKLNQNIVIAPCWPAAVYVLNMLANRTRFRIKTCVQFIFFPEMVSVTLGTSCHTDVCPHVLMNLVLISYLKNRVKCDNWQLNPACDWVRWDINTGSKCKMSACGTRYFSHLYSIQAQYQY